MLIRTALGAAVTRFGCAASVEPGSSTYARIEVSTFWHRGTDDHSLVTYVTHLDAWIVHRSDAGGLVGKLVSLRRLPTALIDVIDHDGRAELVVAAGEEDLALIDDRGVVRSGISIEPGRLGCSH
jgi:hypothetical protein